MASIPEDWTAAKPEDVARIDKPVRLSGQGKMFSPKIMRETLQNLIGEKEQDSILSEKGMPAEFLDAEGGGWKKGRIRVTFEFQPLDRDNPSE